MRLYLVRHAIAYERDAARWPDDAERPLTPRGQKRFRDAARGLRRTVPEVTAVLSSPWVRAWETALLLERHAGWPSPVECDALAGGQPTAAVLEAIYSRAAAPALALVGHEPGISRLAAVLLHGEEGGLAIEFRKGAVACIERDGDEARLHWLLQPRTLRALR